MAKGAKNKRRKKRRGIGLIIIRYILLLLLILGILGVLAFYFCGIKSVVVEGTDLYSDAQIKEYILDDKYSDNAAYVYLKNLIFPKGNAEFIDHFEVKLTGLNSITINCVEKTILGYLENIDGNYIYFNYDGVIAEISPTYVDGYLKLSGVICDESNVGDLLNIGEEKIGYLLALIKQVDKKDLYPNEIYYDEYSRVTLIYDNYNISLGGMSYLEEKLDRLEYILPQIDGMRGTLHLENFSLDNTDIVFEKEIEVAE